MTSARTLLATCIAKGLRVTAAESCTGGMVMAALTDIAGSSAVVDRGYVTYSNQAKIEMLGVQPSTLEAVGAVSEEVAREMAQGALDHSGADLAVSVTGIAGPGGSDFKPEGRVCFAIATHQGCTAETVEFGPLGRENVREAARNHGLALLNKAASAH
nr:CinA family protein [uncultured Shimia sp.]